MLLICYFYKCKRHFELRYILEGSNEPFSKFMDHVEINYKIQGIFMQLIKKNVDWGSFVPE